MHSQSRGRNRLWSQIRSRQIHEIMDRIRTLKFYKTQRQIINSDRVDRVDKNNQGCHICRFTQPQSLSTVIQEQENKHKTFRGTSRSNLLKYIKNFEKYCDDHQSQVIDNAVQFFMNYPHALQELLNRNIIWQTLSIVTILRFLQIILNLCYIVSTKHTPWCTNQNSGIQNPLIQNAFCHEILTGGLVPIIQDKLKDETQLSEINSTINETRKIIVHEFPERLTINYSYQQFMQILQKVSILNPDPSQKLLFLMQILEKLINSQVYSNGTLLNLITNIIQKQLLGSYNFRKINQNTFQRIMHILCFYLTHNSIAVFMNNIQRIIEMYNQFTIDKPISIQQLSVKIAYQLNSIVIQKQDNRPIKIVYCSELKRIVIEESQIYEMQIEEPYF